MDLRSARQRLTDIDRAMTAVTADLAEVAAMLLRKENTFAAKHLLSAADDMHRVHEQVLQAVSEGID